ncbi:MAG: hypothetical protein IJG63_01185, partial [Oscillospiraceae bacterium]|nr:hypothetical protein [Oscillospiraceae bacterium]
PEVPVEEAQVTFEIADIRMTVIDGESYYYMRSTEGDWYVITSATSEYAVFANVGDTVDFTYNKAADDDVLVGLDMKIVPATA